MARVWLRPGDGLSEPHFCSLAAIPIAASTQEEGKCLQSLLRYVSCGMVMISECQRVASWAHRRSSFIRPVSQETIHTQFSGTHKPPRFYHVLTSPSDANTLAVRWAIPSRGLNPQDFTNTIRGVKLPEVCLRAELEYLVLHPHGALASVAQRSLGRLWNSLKIGSQHPNAHRSMSPVWIFPRCTVALGRVLSRE